ARGVVAASTGNHGQGIAFGAALVGTTATICVPRGNNPEKNAAMRAWGATVVEEGRDYDESLRAMQRIAREEGRVVAHSTNDPRIIVPSLLNHRRAPRTRSEEHTSELQSPYDIV